MAALGKKSGGFKAGTRKPIQWTLAILNKVEGKMQLIEEGMKIWDDDPTYGEDVHIAPVVEDGEEFSFGIHDFTRECCCGPKIEEAVHGKNLVIHSERVN